MIPYSDFALTWCQETAKEWIAIIKRNECISALNYTPRGQIYRIKQIFDCIHSSPLLTDETLHFISLDLYSFIDSPVTELSSFLERKKEKLPKKGKIVLCILHADILLTNRLDLLPVLNNLPSSEKNWVNIYLFKKDITAPYYLQKLSHFSTLYQNISIKNSYTPDAIEQFIQALQKEFGTTLAKDVIKDILYNCGNKLWFVKEAIRYIAKTGDTGALFTHDEMTLRLKTTLDDLEEWEKNVIKKIKKGDTQFTPDETHALSYLLQTNFLQKINNTYTITIPILAQYADKYFSEGAQLRIQNTQIYHNSTAITSLFSKREKRLLEYFITNANTVLPREKIGESLWKENNAEEYSDWALDQTIRRLRQKLITLGLPKEILQTRKNQGYILIQN